MNSGKINNFFCKLRNFGSCFFLAFFLNFNSVKVMDGVRRVVNKL